MESIDEDSFAMADCRFVTMTVGLSRIATQSRYCVPKEAIAGKIRPPLRLNERARGSDDGVRTISPVSQPGQDTGQPISRWRFFGGELKIPRWRSRGMSGLPFAVKIPGG